MDDQFDFEETQKAERALSEAESFENDFLAGGYESPSFGTVPETPAENVQAGPSEKRNYEKYLDGETLEPANPFEMPQFIPGGFEGDQGNSGEFNRLGSIPAPQTPPNPYFNPSDNGYNIPPAGGGNNINSANIGALRTPYPWVNGLSAC